VAVLAEAAAVPGRDDDQFQREKEAAVERARDPTLQLLAEELSVGKEARETGRVRVSTRTHEREALIDEDLARDQVEIETIPIARRIDAVPQVRQEGDTTIIPVVEERLVVDRQLMLKEEIRIKRVRTTERHQERVALRHQEAVVTRLPPATTAPDEPAPDAKQQTNPDETKSRR
jgi:uncharacterized protein (TIGR02271 family)